MMIESSVDTPGSSSAKREDTPASAASSEKSAPLRITHIVDFECATTSAYVSKLLMHSSAMHLASLIAPKRLSSEEKVKQACDLADNTNIALYICPFDIGMLSKNSARKRLHTILAETAPQLVHTHGSRAAQLMQTLKESAGYKFYPFVQSFYAETPEDISGYDIKSARITRESADIVLHPSIGIKEELVSHDVSGEDDPVLPDIYKTPEDTAAKLCSVYRSVTFMHKRLSLYAADRLTGQ